MGESSMNAKWVLFFSLLLIILVDVKDASNGQLSYEKDSGVIFLNTAVDTENIHFTTLKAIYR